MSPMSMFAERSKQPLEKMTNPDRGQETETEVVWPHLKVFWLNKYNSTGKRNKCTQKRRWQDNIKEKTGLDFASLTRAADDRTM